MSFMNALKNVAKAAGGSFAEEMTRTQQIKNEWVERYERMSRDELKRELEAFKSGRISTGTYGARYAAFKEVCRTRGYLND